MLIQNRAIFCRGQNSELFRAGYIENKVWAPLPRAVFCEEDDGDVRLTGNGYFSKVQEIGQVVLVGKTPEIILQKSENAKKTKNNK